MGPARLRVRAAASLLAVATCVLGGVSQADSAAHKPSVISGSGTNLGGLFTASSAGAVFELPTRARLALAPHTTLRAELQQARAEAAAPQRDVEIDIGRPVRDRLRAWLDAGQRVRVVAPSRMHADRLVALFRALGLATDVSPGGARIVTDAAFDVRDTFGLALVPDHPKRQPCEVVWRRGKTYGIKFLP